MRKRAVITGVGMVSPLGFGTETFWAAARAGTTACAPIPEQWHEFFQPTSTIWAPLPTSDFSPYGITRIEASQLDKVAQIALICTGEALASADLPHDVRDERKRMWSLRGVEATAAGVFIGTGMGGASTMGAMATLHSTQPLTRRLQALDAIPAAAQAAQDVTEGAAALQVLREVPKRFNPFTVAMTMPNGSAAAVGIRYGLHGRNESCAGACAAGTIAIGHALRAIQSGEMTLALAGGVEYQRESLGGAFRAFDVVHALVDPGTDPATANRPFDSARSGFLFAEGGGAVLVIEELEHAVRRGAPIIAELAGFAETFDAYSVMMPDPSGVQVERMIRMAVADAGMEPADIDYVNTHGTSTVANDVLEAEALTRVFGEGPLVNATKGLIGHTLGASGAIEAAVAALSIRDQTTHPCANLDDPIPGLRYVRASDSYPIRTALSESFAFGGHNAGVVLKAPPNSPA